MPRKNIGIKRGIPSSGRKIAKALLAGTILAGGTFGNTEPGKTGSALQSTGSKDLLTHAQKIEEHYPTHFGAQSAIKIVTEKNYEGMTGEKRFYTATADLTRTMAIQPDWFLGEFFAQNSRFIIDNETISRIDSMSQDPTTFNTHTLRFLKRASLISKGPEGISSSREYGGREVDAKTRVFYHGLTPEQMEQAAQVYKEAFNFYRQNDVELDALCLDRSITGTTIFDLFIARKFKNDDRFKQAASKNPKWGQEIVDAHLVHPRSLYRFPVFDLSDEKGWMDAFKTIHKEENNPEAPNIAIDTHSMVQSARAIVNESSKSRFTRVAYYYQRLAELYLNQDGSIKKDVISKKVLGFIAKAKIRILKGKTEEITGQANSEKDEGKKSAMLELAKSWQDRMKTLQEKYVK